MKIPVLNDLKIYLRKFKFCYLVMQSSNYKLFGDWVDVMYCAPKQSMDTQ